MLHLETRDIYVAPLTEAREFLRRNQPKATSQTLQHLSPEEWDKLVTEFEKQMQERLQHIEIGQPCTACGLLGWIRAEDGGYDKCVVCNGEKFLK
jgi:hypothetical protein